MGKQVTAPPPQLEKLGEGEQNYEKKEKGPDG